MDYPLPDLPFFLPTIPIPEFIDLEALKKHFSTKFEFLNESHFIQDAVWRDNFVFTGTLRTFYSQKSIAAAWQETTKIHRPTSWTFQGYPHVVRAGDAHWVEMKFTFETHGVPAMTADGMMSIIPEKDGAWRIWMLRTIIGNLKGQPSVDELHPEQTLNGETLANGRNGTSELTNGTSRVNRATANGTCEVNGAATNFTNEHTEHVEHSERPAGDFETVVIGGGQAGIGVGARLKALGLSYVVMDKFEDIGDSWAKRYDSTRLHTVREFAHLPYERTFPATYQEFLTKDDLSKGFREWQAKFNINLWTSTTVLSGQWVAEHDQWELKVQRGGEEQTVKCNYIVLAVGANSRFPIQPTYENREAFKGIAMHSADYTSAEKWAGQHGIVVGSGNTAHDVADDMQRAGLASVTMVQRNPTFVIPVELYRETHDRAYNAHTPTETADMMFFTGPAVMTRVMAAKTLHAKIRANPERFDALEKAGFLLDRYADMGYVIFVRQGGHYMDVGTSGKIVAGLIKMKTDSMPVRYVEDGLICANGDHLKADVVVFATGFVGNMKIIVAELLGNDIASQIEDFWGLDEEGETRGAFKPSGHPGLWLTGGAIGQARYMSRFVALQIKAKSMGTPLPIYSKIPPRNSSDRPTIKKLT